MIRVELQQKLVILEGTFVTSLFAQNTDELEYGPEENSGIAIEGEVQSDSLPVFAIQLIVENIEVVNE